MLSMHKEGQWALPRAGEAGLGKLLRGQALRKERQKFIHKQDRARERQHEQNQYSILVFGSFFLNNRCCNLEMSF